MKHILFVVLALNSAFAFAKTCPAQQDNLQCGVTASVSGVETHREEFNISVFSSTYLCDGRNNRFHYQEYPLAGTSLKAAIFADWDGYRFAVYDVNDTAGVDGAGTDAFAQTWMIRSLDLSHIDALDGRLGDARYFIWCQTVERTTESLKE